MDSEVKSVCLSANVLTDDNARYADTGGVSANNRDAGFIPAYRNPCTGQVALSCLADGRPAPVHTLEGLPADWVAERDANGKTIKLVEGIVAGFCRQGRFYTRQEAAEAMRNCESEPPSKARPDVEPQPPGQL